jgi:predicted acyl esterase
MVNNPTTGVQNDPIIGSVVPGTGILAPTQPVTAATALHYRMPAYAADTAVLGPVHLSLWLSSTNPNSVITARMFDVSEDGTKTLVTRGATRATGLGITVPARVTFDLFDTHHLFKQGHSIELELSPSDTPFFVADAQTLAIRFHHDDKYPSFAEIPVWSGS